EDVAAPLVPAARRREVVLRLERSGRGVIALTNDQIASFAGNALELQGNAARILALSTTALASLSRDQRNTIEESAELVALDIPTIERAGGSVRCTLAGIHLTPR
ncbi:arginine deiminase-related protein, partial [Rhizobium johnstonii]